MLCDKSTPRSASEPQHSSHSSSCSWFFCSAATQLGKAGSWALGCRLGTGSSQISCPPAATPWSPWNKTVSHTGQASVQPLLPSRLLMSAGQSKSCDQPPNREVGMFAPRTMKLWRRCGCIILLQESEGLELKIHLAQLGETRITQGIWKGARHQVWPFYLYLLTSQHFSLLRACHCVFIPLTAFYHSAELEKEANMTCKAEQL